MRSRLPGESLFIESLIIDGVMGVFLTTSF